LGDNDTIEQIATSLASGWGRPVCLGNEFSAINISDLVRLGESSAFLCITILLTDDIIQVFYIPHIYIVLQIITN
jgi:hypothetical protein